jgi:hypothetical protein
MRLVLACAAAPVKQTKATTTSLSSRIVVTRLDARLSSIPPTVGPSMTFAFGLV